MGASASVQAKPPRRRSTATAQKWPMWVLPLVEFLKLERMTTYQELRDSNLLRHWRLSSRTVFISHQWLAYDHPDPNGEQLRVAQTQLRRLRAGEISEINPNWMQKLTFPNDKTKPLRRKYLVEMLNDPEADVWIDYGSITQLIAAKGSEARAEQERELAAAVASISSYAERAEIMMVVAPPLPHLKRKAEVCDFSSWLSRGWCILERMARQAAVSPGVIIKVADETGTPEMLLSWDWMTASPGLGHFTCCARGHVDDDGVPYACDKISVGVVCVALLTSLIEALRERAEYSSEVRRLLRFTLANVPSLLAGLPGTVVADFVSRVAPSELEPWAVQFGFKNCILGDTEALRSGWTPIRFAVIQNNAPIVESLLRKIGAGSSEHLECPIRRNHPKLIHVAGFTILHSASMCASSNVIEMLLDAGAKPHAQTGMQRLTPWHVFGTGTMFGGSKGWLHGEKEQDRTSSFTVDKIRTWLRRFPQTDVNSAAAGPFGETQLFLLGAIGKGEDAAEAVRWLLKERPELNCDIPQHFGATPVINLVGINDHFQRQVLLALLGSGANPSQICFATTRKIRTVVAVMRRMHKMLGRMAPEVVMRVAIGQGGTALHAACQTGNVIATRVLLAHGVDESIVDARGFTALDYAEGRGESRIGPFPAVANIFQEDPEERKKRVFTEIDKSADNVLDQLG